MPEPCRRQKPFAAIFRSDFLSVPQPRRLLKRAASAEIKFGAAHARGHPPGNEVSVSMSAAPLLQPVALLAAVIVIALATRSGRLHPFLALLIVATGFGFAGGLSTSLIGKAFGVGFSQAIYSSGLAIVAAGFVSGIIETTAASDWLTATLPAPVRIDRTGNTRRTGCGPRCVAGFSVRAPHAILSRHRRQQFPKPRGSADCAGAGDFRRPRAHFIFAGRGRGRCHSRRGMGADDFNRRAGGDCGRGGRRGVGKMAIDQT